LRLTLASARPEHMFEPAHSRLLRVCLESHAERATRRSRMVREAA
jgi:hypothetical protein